MKKISSVLFIAALMFSLVSFTSNVEADSQVLKDGFYVAAPEGNYFFEMSDLLNPAYTDMISDAFDYGFQYVYLYESGEVINIYENMVNGKDFETYVPGSIPSGNYKDVLNEIVPISGNTNSENDFVIVNIY